jgi:hypothetical protein
MGVERDWRWTYAQVYKDMQSEGEREKRASISRICRSGERIAVAWRRRRSLLEKGIKKVTGREWW